MSMPLPHSLMDSREFVRKHQPGLLVGNQPDALYEERQQEKSCEQLRRSKAFTGEKFRHEANGLFYHVSSTPWGGLVETDQNPIPDNSPVVQPVSTPPQYSIFVGPHGLRYGWRFVIYVAAVVGLVIVFSMITRTVVAHFHKEHSLWLF